MTRFTLQSFLKDVAKADLRGYFLRIEFNGIDGALDFDRVNPRDFSVRGDCIYTHTGGIIPFNEVFQVEFINDVNGESIEIKHYQAYAS